MQPVYRSGLSGEVGGEQARDVRPSPEADDDFILGDANARAYADEIPEQGFGGGDFEDVPEPSGEHWVEAAGHARHPVAARQGVAICADDLVDQRRLVRGGKDSLQRVPFDSSHGFAVGHSADPVALVSLEVLSLVADIPGPQTCLYLSAEPRAASLPPLKTNLPAWLHTSSRQVTIIGLRAAMLPKFWGGAELRR